MNQHRPYRPVFARVAILIPLIAGIYLLHQLISFPASLSQFPGLDILKDDPVNDKIGGPTLSPQKDYLVRGNSSMVALDVKICSEMGHEILLRNGNAADAAVTVALCIGSVNSHSSGIGGGAFILLWPGQNSTTSKSSGFNLFADSAANTGPISIDARESAPLAAHKHMYDGMPLLAQFGGLAVATPGELAGLYELYSRHGSGNLSWADLFQPVVELNRRGWIAQKTWVLSVHKIHVKLLSWVPLLRHGWDFIYRPDGSVVQEGDLITRPQYAESLEKIGRNGSSAIFYDPEGPFAPSLVKRAASCGGSITVDDFANYKPRVTEALRFTFCNDGSEYDLATTAGVSSGLALIAGLNFFSYLYEKFPFKPDGMYMHRLIESMKWIASARSHLGDHEPEQFRMLQEKFTSRQWAQQLFENGKYNDSTTFTWPHYEPQYELTEPKGTSHFSVVDSQGGAVSMTTTVNLIFGSSVYDNTTGIILNDEMDDFSMPNVHNAFNLTPSKYNFIAPQKRPLSLTTPTIMRRDGELFLLIGAAGGSRIVTAVLQAIVRIIYEKLPLLQVVLFPRVHHQLIPEYVMAENTTMLEDSMHGLQGFLENKNHSIFESGALTAMNGIQRVDGIWQGVSDFWRKGGVAAGS